MSSEPPKDTPADRPTEPFARGRIQWGRPPQQVFRAGPLPGASGVAAAPRPQPAASILSGSMIPPARPAAAEPEPVAPEAPVEVAAPVEAEAVVPPPPLEPEPVVEPVFEPVAAAPEPEPVAVAPQEIVIEPEAAEPAVTVPTPLSGEARPTAQPRELPSVVVTPTLYATMGAAVQKAAKGGRWTIFAGIAAVVIIGGFIWLATLPAPQPVADTPTPLVAGAAPLSEVPLAETPPAAASTPAAATPAPAVTAPAATAPATPATTAARRPATTPAAPVVVAPPSTAETAPRPYIETAPLVIDPPTPATPAQQDPDAPITTRPQPLD